MSGPLEVGVDARRRHRGVLVSDVVCQDEDVLQMSLRVSDVVIKERFDVEAEPAEHGVGCRLGGPRALTGLARCTSGGPFIYLARIVTWRYRASSRAHALVELVAGHSRTDRRDPNWPVAPSGWERLVSAGARI